MSRSTIHQQLTDLGIGPTGVFNVARPTDTTVPISTGTWIGKWTYLEEHRRLGITVSVGRATGAVGDAGGFTGVLELQATDEVPRCDGPTGTVEAGNRRRPGINGYTGALYATTIARLLVDNTLGSSVPAARMDIVDVDAAFVRLAFNRGITPGIGSGTMYIHMTAKNT